MHFVRVGGYELDPAWVGEGGMIGPHVLHHPNQGVYVVAIWKPPREDHLPFAGGLGLRIQPVSVVEVFVLRALNVKPGNPEWIVGSAQSVLAESEAALFGCRLQSRYVDEKQVGGATPGLPSDPTGLFQFAHSHLQPGQAH
jgi:hypothetical protein